VEKSVGVLIRQIESNLSRPVAPSNSQTSLWLLQANSWFRPLALYNVNINNSISTGYRTAPLFVAMVGDTNTYHAKKISLIQEREHWISFILFVQGTNYHSRIKNQYRISSLGPLKSDGGCHHRWTLHFCHLAPYCTVL